MPNNSVKMVTIRLVSPYLTDLNTMPFVLWSLSGMAKNTDVLLILSNNQMRTRFLSLDFYVSLRGIKMDLCGNYWVGLF